MKLEGPSTSRQDCVLDGGNQWVQLVQNSPCLIGSLVVNVLGLEQLAEADGTLGRYLFALVEQSASNVCSLFDQSVARLAPTTSVPECLPFLA